jgi:predicted dehydrogenase
VTERLRIGVVGCGQIAQVMHLPYLEELSDRYEVVAVCDISETVASARARHDMRLCELVARAHLARAVPTSVGNGSVAIAAGSAE